MVEFLLSVHEALSSITSTINNQAKWYILVMPVLEKQKQEFRVILSKPASVI